MAFPKSSARVAAMLLLPPAILIGTAGDSAWWTGWAYVAALLALTLGARLLVSRLHPGLLEERASSFGRDGAKDWDRVIVSVLVGICPLATWVAAGLDHRAGRLLHDSPALVALGLVVLVLGGALTAWAMAANRFFSTVVRIQHDRGHAVVTGGPYRWVRHPGYLGALAVNLVTPVVLQSAWALVPAGLALAAVVYRTAREDRTLAAELAGYPAYAARTRYRLLPGIW